MLNRIKAFRIVLCVLSCGLAAMRAAPTSAQPPRSATPTVAAEVNSTRIYIHLLEQDMASSVKGRKLTAAARKVLQAQVLDRVVTRIAIIDYLADTAQGAKPKQVEAALDHLKKQLAKRKMTLDQFLAKSKILKSDLEMKLAWQICWGQYLRRYVTEVNLRSYFEKNRRAFDGTQLRVQHILLKKRQTAEKLRADIVAGKITFADAARQHSQSPSGAKGGDIGWISRTKPMVESFSRAAYALKTKGTISEPIKTPHGVHLIRYVDLKVGKRTWKQAEGDLRRAVTEYLLDWLGTEARKGARISYTDAWPHFDALSKQKR